MNSRRTLILIAAVLIGAVAAFALLNYVNGIEDRANDNAERVQIFKIDQDIPKGTFGEEAFRQELIVSDEIPREFRPATAINDPADITGKVAISNLAANQVVVGDQFVSQAEAVVTFSQFLELGDPDDPTTQRTAITISVDQIRGVAGLLVPGDFVNVLVGVEDPDAEEAAAGGEGAPPADLENPVVYDTPARYLYQKVQILAIGQQRVLQPGETAATNEDGTLATGTAGLVTLSVPADAAQRIASVPADGIYLTLVPKDYQPYPLPPIDTFEDLPGETDEELTPYGPAGPTGD